MVEAVLFTTGKFMSIEDISKASGVASVGAVKELVETLKQTYDQRQGSLIVQEQGGLYKMGLRDEYKILAQKLIANNEFDNPTTKTLAVIAYKQPALQAEVVKIRGNKAYDHLRQLRETGFITSEKSGRTRLLRVTPKFYEYFDTSQEQLKQTFEKIQQEGPEQESIPADSLPSAAPSPTLPTASQQPSSDASA